MPLPVALAPIATVALRYGAVALAGYALARRIEPGRRCQHAEDAHDRLDEGVTLRHAAEQVNTTARFRRILRLGEAGPGLEIDASALGRLRVRRV
ncbi:hypothetical protein [Actibacterium sp. MT2.3-13A]|uniref:hypothetical protein n=1 Tax=Actibacterium sp. MT2.3-13A TaxID=2828332 RepID=UPI001BAA1C14|nr:hypothetical protein [Actibacterium sp. MT2.3-13A]